MQKRPDWRGRLFHSPSIPFAHWGPKRGLIDQRARARSGGGLEVTINGAAQVAGPGIVVIVPGKPANRSEPFQRQGIVVHFPWRVHFSRERSDAKRIGLGLL